MKHHSRRVRKLDYIGNTGVRYLTEKEIELWYAAIDMALQRRKPANLRAVQHRIDKLLRSKAPA